MKKLLTSLIVVLMFVCFSSIAMAGEPCAAVTKEAGVYKQYIQNIGKESPMLNNYLNLFVKTPDDVIELVESLTDSKENIQFTRDNKVALYWLFKTTVIAQVGAMSSNGWEMTNNHFAHAVTVIGNPEDSRKATNAIEAQIEEEFFMGNGAYKLYKMMTTGRDYFITVVEAFRNLGECQ